uniref:Uncharacterized protein n=1 Tax=Chromera velia CCMP2878 TaxID=1169474 RepID=A0A0G4FQJ8_9ALVE|eukprot:Cvel_461.t1-p1 / transcript=Cvel_461.t1 / gene=Cvel_461 / organism=Chromera_velia_CCMP2878 / gene_product=hypothetical protein / transcript_product=hypothetical protein / location=Cvel_scaffold14:216113-217855(+) / protein_length=581 / sequence_SO=supercontig / SO=protein_coding / is_pseudo=false
MSPSQLALFAAALGMSGAPALHELILPEGKPDEPPEGAAALARAYSLGYLSQLTAFMTAPQLSITSETFRMLGHSMAAGRSPQLQSLVLVMYDENPEEGVGALADAICGGMLSLLQSFQLVLFRTRGDAISTLGVALGGGVCPALEKLDLAWLEEGDEGAAGLAEGLGRGGLRSLRDLNLGVKCVGGGEGRGYTALGEALSTGKVHSLRNLTLFLYLDPGLAPLCEGLSRGRVAPPVRLHLHLSGNNRNGEIGVRRLAEITRGGKLSGLHKLVFGCSGGAISREAWREFGEALTHAEASLNSLERLRVIRSPDLEWFTPFLSGLARGSGRLPAFCDLFCDNRSPISPQAAHSVSALVSRGSVPFLRDLEVNVSNIGQEGMQAFASALGSPHVSALRRLDIAIGGSVHANSAVHVQMFSNALSSRHLRRLETLCVRGVGFVQEIRTLCVGLGSGQLAALRELRICDSHLGAEGGSVLSKVLVAEKLPCSESFEAHEAELTDGGVSALTETWMSHPPPPIRHLNLWGNELTAAAAEALLGLLGLKRLSLLESMILRSQFDFDERSRRLLSGLFPEIVEFREHY